MHGLVVNRRKGKSVFYSVDLDRHRKAEKSIRASCSSSKSAVAPHDQGHRRIRKTQVFGPFVPLLRSPELMLRASAMGDYLRYRDALPPKLNEFIILIVARQWTQEYEWSVHYPIALKAGLDPQIAKAVAEGRRPAKMPEDEEIVYEFSTELHHNKSVSDATYSRAVAKFGEQGMMDMVGMNGYYTLLAMVINVGRTPVAKDYTPMLAPLPH